MYLISSCLFSKLETVSFKDPVTTTILSKLVQHHVYYATVITDELIESSDIIIFSQKYPYHMRVFNIIPLFIFLSLTVSF